MRTDGRKSFLKGVPSLALALIAMFITALAMMAISEINFVYGYITLAVLIPIACFFICRNDPRSVWYVPVLCNALSLLPLFGDEGVRTASVWTIFCIGWVLSVILSIIGARIGKRAAMNDNFQTQDNSLNRT